MTVAALGGSIDVPTLEGKMARLTIDAGTQSGTKIPYARQRYASASPR